MRRLVGGGPEPRAAGTVPALAVAIAFLLTAAGLYLVVADDPDATVFAALDVGATDDEPGPSSSTATPEDLPPVTVATPTDLGALLLTDAPPGFELIPDNVGDTGPLDLAQAADQEEDPDAARRILERVGYVRGHSRSWASADGRVVVAIAYGFHTEPGAQQYLDTFVLGVKLQSAELFPAPDISGAQGLTQDDAIDGEDFQFHSVVFRKGAVVFQVGVGGPPGATTPDLARDVAKRQWAKP